MKRNVTWTDLNVTGITSERNPKIVFSRRFGGGSVMIVWVAFSIPGETTVGQKRSRHGQDDKDYMFTLQKYILQVASLLGGQNWVFFNKTTLQSILQKSSKIFSRIGKTNVMEWPACSPDLNPTENQCNGESLFGTFTLMLREDSSNSTLSMT